MQPGPHPASVHSAGRRQHSGAHWVREQSRSVANRMGAEVDEMDLGQSEDKTKLVYGSPGKLRSTATHLRTARAASLVVNPPRRMVVRFPAGAQRAA